MEPFRFHMQFADNLDEMYVEYCNSGQGMYNKTSRYL